MQSVKALIGTAGWGDPKQESDMVEAKIGKNIHSLHSLAVQINKKPPP